MAEVAVIVPVLNRPQNAAPFMESLRASGADFWCYPVGTDTDMASIGAWMDAWGQITTTPRTTFAEKVNAVLPFIDGPWLFLCGDDVRFTPGWWEQVMVAHRHHGALVIGTNDGSGSAADFSPHVAIQRAYVGKVGASWDGPGVVCHEGYRHNYVDNEIIAAAKQRHVWFMCREAMVEHLHPVWGKGEMDDTYALGNRSANDDRALFDARMLQYG